MLRPVRLVLAFLVSLLVGGCATSEVKNTNAIGLVNGVPSGTVQAGYGDGRGDSVGGGGASPAIDWHARNTSEEGR